MCSFNADNPRGFDNYIMLDPAAPGFDVVVNVFFPPKFNRDNQNDLISDGLIILYCFILSGFYSFLICKIFIGFYVCSGAVICKS